MFANILILNIIIPIYNKSIDNDLSQENFVVLKFKIILYQLKINLNEIL